MKRFNSLAVTIASLLSTGAMASAPDTEAVEYYNAFTKHYFVTATASESRIIDSGGAGEGWMRTGRSFQAWLAKASAPANASPVCRFYSSGANSHFYTASAGECEGLKEARSGWQYEGIAFYIQSPAAGRCPAGTTELVRAYNNGFATGEGSNHRFIDDPSLHELMVENRWIPEGTVFCATPKSTGTGANLPSTTTDFAALKGTWSGNAKWEREDRDDHEATEALTLSFAADGAIAGSGYGCTFTGKVASGDGFRSLFIGSVTASGCSDASFNGGYLRIKLQRFGVDSLLVRLKRGDDESEVTIAARLTNAAATAPSVPSAGRFDGLAGNWIGTVGWEAEAPGTHTEVNKPLELTIASTGSFTGAGFGCTLTGSLASGQATASGCEVSIFNGPLAVRVEREGNGRIEIAFKRESRAGEVEIEGTLHRAGANAPAPVPVADPTLVGQWQGAAAWRAGSASGSGTVRFTVDANGTLSGSGFGCALNGTLKLAMNGRAVIGGSVSTSGCATSALNVTFTAIEFEREDGDAFEFELEREVNGVKVKVKGWVARSA